VVNDAKHCASADSLLLARKITGVVAIKCARHAFVEQVGDLNKGEQYGAK
jgi:hypothetical protein